MALYKYAYYYYYIIIWHTNDTTDIIDTQLAAHRQSAVLYILNCMYSLNGNYGQRGYYGRDATPIARWVIKCQFTYRAIS